MVHRIPVVQPLFNHQQARCQQCTVGLLLVVTTGHRLQVTTNNHLWDTTGHRLPDTIGLHLEGTTGHRLLDTTGHEGVNRLPSSSCPLNGILGH